MHRLLITTLCLPLLGQSPELRSTAADRKALSITIYQNDLAAVRDTRTVNLPSGQTALAFSDLAAKIRAKSAYLLDPGPGLTVLERNFEFNLISPTNLKLAGLDQPVALRTGKRGDWRWGTQLSIPYPKGIWNSHATPFQKMARMSQTWIVRPTEEVLVQGPDGIQGTGGLSVAYKQVPATLRSSPTLLQTVQVPATGPRDLTLLYTTEGLSWQAHYIVTLATDAKHLDLDAFATVENKSGISYPGATFQLIAGTPNVVPDPNPTDENGPSPMEATTATVEVVADVASPPVFKEEKLSEYPLFTLDRPVTLLDGQRKQLALFQAHQVPLEIQATVAPGNWNFDGEEAYLTSCNDSSEPPPDEISMPPSWLDQQPDTADAYGQLRLLYLENKEARQNWEADHHPSAQLEGRIKNIKRHGLGRNLPGGMMDIRYLAPGGACLPMRTTPMDGTPRGESIQLDLGPARGILATRKVLTMHPVLVGDDGACLELQMEVTLSNKSSRSIRTIIREPIFHDWTLVKANLPGHRSAQNAYEFTLSSKPHQTFRLRYTVRTPVTTDFDPF